MSRGSLRYLCLALVLVCGFGLAAEAGSKQLTAEQVQTAMSKVIFLQDALTTHLDSTRTAVVVTQVAVVAIPSHPQRRNAKAGSAKPQSVAGVPKRHDREAFAAKRAQQSARRSLQRIEHLLTIAEVLQDRDAAGAMRRIEQAVHEIQKIERRLGIQLVIDAQEVSR